MAADLVFGLPHAGGGRHQYLSWTEELREVTTWIPMEYAGRFTRDHEPPYESFGDAVADLTMQIEQQAEGLRIGLFGHSLGGSFAYEIGRALATSGRVTLDALVISSAEPPSRSTADRHRYFELDDEAFIEHLTALVDPSTQPPPHRMLLSAMLPVIRSDYRLHHSYHPEVGTSVNTPLHICVGCDEPLADETAAWQRHSSVPITVHRFDGNHFYWRPDAAPLTAALRRIFSHQRSTSETRKPLCQH